MKPGCSSACTEDCQYAVLSHDFGGAHISEVELSLSSYICIRIDGRLNPVPEHANVHFGDCLARCAQYDGRLSSGDSLSFAKEILGIKRGISRTKYSWSLGSYLEETLRRQLVPVKRDCKRRSNKILQLLESYRCRRKLRYVELRSLALSGTDAKRLSVEISCSESKYYTHLENVSKYGQSNAYTPPASGLEDRHADIL